MIKKDDEYVTSVVEDISTLEGTEFMQPTSAIFVISRRPAAMLSRASRRHKLHRNAIQ